jgi:hypothetical protein
MLQRASSRIRSMTTRILENPQSNRSGYYYGHLRLILGLLYKIKKNRALALEHLFEAKRVLSEIGQTPALARVDAALAELGQ